MMESKQAEQHLFHYEIFDYVGLFGHTHRTNQTSCRWSSAARMKDSDDNALKSSSVKSKQLQVSHQSYQKYQPDWMKMIAESNFRMEG